MPISELDARHRWLCGALQKAQLPLEIPVAGATAEANPTETNGRGEGGLLLVPKDNELIARHAINFGYDSTLPPHQRAFHIEASNWRMGDFQAAAILANWELGFDIILQWMDDNDRDIVDVGPFKRGLRGSIMSCLLETRQPRPTMEIKYYYQPLGPNEQFPECWRLFDAFQARPFHP